MHKIALGRDNGRLFGGIRVIGEVREFSADTQSNTACQKDEICPEGA